MEYLNAFLCGGILCAIGQILIDRTCLTPARIWMARGIFSQIRKSQHMINAVIEQISKTYKNKRYFFLFSKISHPFCCLFC